MLRRFFGLPLKIARAGWNFLKSIVRKFQQLYGSNKEQLRKSGPLTKFMLYLITGLFIYALISFALNMMIMFIGVAINSYFLHKIINMDHLKLNPITRDIVSPVVGLLTFALSTYVYLVFPELTIVLVIFVVPQVLSDFFIKFTEYDETLEKTLN